MSQEPKNNAAEEEIPQGHIVRNLDGGAIPVWLVAGPYAEHRPAATAAFLAWQPSEGGAVRRPDGTPDANELGLWHLVACAEDHLMHLDVRGEMGKGGQAWMFATLESPREMAATLLITHSQPVEIWLNTQRHAFAMPDATDAAGLGETEVAITLQAGQNDLWIFAEATRDARWVVGARVASAQDDADTAAEEVLTVRYPTSLEPVVRRDQLEAITHEAFLEQNVYQAKERIHVKWPATSDLFDNLTVRLQAPNRRIYAEGYIEATAGTDIPVAWPDRLPDGRYDMVLMPKPAEYYEKKVRYSHRIPLRVVKNAHSSTYYGDYAGRSQEALTDAAKRKGLFAQIARMALDMWDKVDAQTVDAALAAVIEVENEVESEAENEVEARAAGRQWTALGLLGMHLRFGASEHYQAAWRESVHRLAQALATDETGAQAARTGASAREDAELVALALPLLARRVLAGEGDASDVHADAHAEALLAWMTARARWGFGAWDSPVEFERFVAVLSHLVDLVDNPDVVDMAAVLLDKIFLALGMNSFLGVFGGAHRSTSAEMIVSPGMAATAGLTRLAWGKGTFNDHMLGAVSLACARIYEVPEIVAATAVDESTPLLSRERHRETPVPVAHTDLNGNRAESAEGGSAESAEVHKVTYRTATALLSSALDYRAGAPGGSTHVWQATLGSTAIVFTNHPACAWDGPALVPNGHTDPTGTAGFWCGNGALPRVAQADDLLVAWYRIPEDARMDFTHAYFPTTAFDEYRVTENWAFGRRGSGYVALYASPGLTRITTGPSAYRELRAPGRTAFWLCRVGSAAEDGSFAEFVAATEQTRVRIEGLQAHVQNAWGRDVVFGWEGPLRVGKTGAELDEWPLRFAQHYSGGYAQADFPADTLEVDYQGHGLRLTFSPQAAPEGE